MHNFAELHKELWTWLHDNPNKDREGWPKYDRNGGSIKLKHDCFACIVARKKMNQKDQLNKLDDMCGYCPLEWEDNTTCNDHDSVYEYYVMSRRLYMQIHKYPEMEEEYTLRVKRYAKEIAETPWKGKQEYDINLY